MRLLDRARAALRTRHYSPRTEKAYVSWMVRYVRHCGMRHPRDCGAPEVQAFLEVLTTRRKVGASTQNQALAALTFLYRDVLAQPLDRLPAVVRPKAGHRLPNIIEPPDVERVLAALSGVPQLVARLLYGSGLRLQEALALRVKDLDLDRRAIVVRAGKGDRDRRTMLPERLVPVLRERLSRIRQHHLQALARGGGRYPLPGSLDRKFADVARDWRWAWLFPARRDVWDRACGQRVRYPVHASTIQRAIALAAIRSGVAKRVTAHTFRHSFATQLLRSGYDIRTVQELLGHVDVSTTMVYLHVLDRGSGVRSPLDQLNGPPPTG